MPGHTIVIKMGKDIETLSKYFRSPQIPLIQGVLATISSITWLHGSQIPALVRGHEMQVDALAQLKQATEVQRHPK